MGSWEKINHPVGVKFGYFLNKLKQLINKLSLMQYLKLSCKAFLIGNDNLNNNYHAAYSLPLSYFLVLSSNA